MHRTFCILAWLNVFVDKEVLDRSLRVVGLNCIEETEIECHPDVIKSKFRDKRINPKTIMKNQQFRKLFSDDAWNAFVESLKLVTGTCNRYNTCIFVVFLYLF